MHSTRLGICGEYGQYVHGNPGKRHWEAARWILRYLSGTTDKGLLYARSKRQDDMVSGYVDARYAGCYDTRKSLIGYMFKYLRNLVSWNLQHVVSLSSTEAEFIAITKAIKEVI